MSWQPYDHHARSDECADFDVDTFRYITSIVLVIPVIIVSLTMIVCLCLKVDQHRSNCLRKANEVCFYLLTSETQSDEPEKLQQVLAFARQGLDHLQHTISGESFNGLRPNFRICGYILVAVWSWGVYLFAEESMSLRKANDCFWIVAAGRQEDHG